MTTVQVNLTPTVEVTGDLDAPVVSVLPGSSVSVVVQGAPGPQGDEGPMGAGASYEHVQNTPSLVWTVQHNLNMQPQPTVLDTDGNVVIGWDPTWPSTNVLLLTFPAPLAGRAFVS